MSTITNCPECGKTMSINQTVCPQCGWVRIRGAKMYTEHKREQHRRQEQEEHQKEAIHQENLRKEEEQKRKQANEFQREKAREHEQKKLQEEAIRQENLRKEEEQKRKQTEEQRKIAEQRKAEEQRRAAEQRLKEEEQRKRQSEFQKATSTPKPHTPPVQTKGPAPRNVVETRYINGQKYQITHIYRNKAFNLMLSICLGIYGIHFIYQKNWLLFFCSLLGFTAVCIFGANQIMAGLAIALSFLGIMWVIGIISAFKKPGPYFEITKKKKIN